MKQISILLAMVFVALQYAFSQSVIIVQNDLGASQHLTLTDALDASQDGDFIYVPGGSFNIGSLLIEKQVHIFGAGHNPNTTQATGTTVLVGNMYFLTASSGSSIHGIYLAGDLYIGNAPDNATVNGLLINRCNINQLALSPDGLSYYGSANITVRESIVRYYFYGANATPGVLVENSIILNQLIYFNGSAVFRNNVFLFPTGFLNNTNNQTFENNILLMSPDYGLAGSNNVFTNNYINTAFIGGNLSFNNVINPANPFVNVPQYTFDYAYDFHLLPGSEAEGAGLNGTDCGIYGGDNPWKESALPINPHISFKSIPVTTDAEGILNIQINSEAQDE